MSARANARASLGDSTCSLSSVDSQTLGGQAAVMTALTVKLVPSCTRTCVAWQVLMPSVRVFIAALRTAARIRTAPARAGIRTARAHRGARRRGADAGGTGAARAGGRARERWRRSSRSRRGLVDRVLLVRGEAVGVVVAA